LLLAWAKQRRDQTIAQSSLFVLLLSAGKGLLFDVAGEDQVVRIFCLLLLGAALYFAGLVFREAKSWGVASK
jgi:ABC-type enterobactin transport system permease subunit